jgi:exopolysaccharide production protein ExoQ
MHRDIGLTGAAKAKRPYLEVVLVSVMFLVATALPALGKHNDGADNSTLNQVVWSLMYVVVAIRAFTMRSRVVPLVKRSISIWVFVALMCASVGWSVAPGVTLSNSIELAGSTLIGYYLVARFSLSEFLGILLATFALIAIASLGLVFGAPGHGRDDWGSGPWAGIFPDKNALGAEMALAVIAAVCFPAKGRNAWLLTLGALGLFSTLLLGSSSATALGDGVATSAAVMLGLGCRSAKFGKIAKLATGACFVAVATAFVFFGVTPASLPGMLGRSATLTGRTDFWPVLQQAIADSPVLGYGYNAFFRSSVGAKRLSAYVVEAGGWTPSHAHNSLLQISLDAGVVGVLVLGYALIRATFRSVVYFAGGKDRSSAWPFALVLFLVLGSYTESYFGMFNSAEWVFFVAAMLYPLREEVFARELASRRTPVERRFAQSATATSPQSS